MSERAVDGAILESYLQALTMRGMSAATLRAVRADLRQFVQWWEDHMQRTFDLSQLLARDLRAWKVTRQRDDGVAPATINRALTSLRRFCDWGRDQGLLADNPARDIEDVPCDPPAPRALPDEAVDALLRAAHQQKNVVLRIRDEALLGVLIYAGLRSQEVCDVQLRDLDLPGSAIVVRHGKGGKARRVPLHDEAHRLLSRYLKEVRCPLGLPDVGSLAEREPLFSGLQNNRKGIPLKPGLSTRLIRLRLSQLGSQAAQLLRTAATREADLLRQARLITLSQQVERASPHMLRHSLAKRLLRNGAALPEVQRILGHHDLSTTGKYLTPSEEELHQAINNADL